MPRRTGLQPPTPRHFRALPAYLGGKRRLALLIVAAIQEVVPATIDRPATFLDPFSGGGAVALHAKASGYATIASDLAPRAVVVARAVIANSHRRLVPLDLWTMLRAATDATIAPAPAALAIFPAEQARLLTAAFAHAASQAEPGRSLLQLLLIKLMLRAVPMSLPNATDARHAAVGDWDRISPRRLGHYLRARELFRADPLRRLAEEINAGVFGGVGRAAQGDALELIQRTQADVVYLDPPYAATTGYARSYALLDQMLGDPPPPDRRVELAALLAAAQHIPVLALSYGGPTASLPDLVQLVREFRPVTRALAIHHPHLAAVATEETNATRFEYLVVAGPA